MIMNLKLAGKSKSLIDVEIRWHTELDMIESVLELKGHCKDMESMDKKFNLSEEDWKKLAEIRDALMHRNEYFSGRAITSWRFLRHVAEMQV